MENGGGDQHVFVFALTTQEMLPRHLLSPLLVGANGGSSSCDKKVLGTYIPISVPVGIRCLSGFACGWDICGKSTLDIHARQSKVNSIGYVSLVE